MKPSILAATALAATVACALGSAAGAQGASAAQGQTWPVTGGTYTFLGCSTAPAAQAPGAVQCGLTFVQTVPGEGGVFELDPRNVQAFSETGQLTRATRVNVASQGFAGPNTVASSQGRPIGVLFELGSLPAGTATVRALIIEGHKLDNVPVSNVPLPGVTATGGPALGSPAAGAPGTATPSRPGRGQLGTGMPGMGTPGMNVPGMNMGVPGGLAIPGGFSVQFSDCRITGEALTCTATFTRTR